MSRPLSRLNHLVDRQVNLETKKKQLLTRRARGGRGEEKPRPPRPGRTEATYQTETRQGRRVASICKLMGRVLPALRYRLETHASTRGEQTRERANTRRRDAKKKAKQKMNLFFCAPRRHGAPRPDPARSRTRQKKNGEPTRQGETNCINK